MFHIKTLLEKQHKESEYNLCTQKLILEIDTELALTKVVLLKSLNILIPSLRSK